MIDFKKFVKEYCITGSIDSGLTRVNLNGVQNNILENYQNKSHSYLLVLFSKFILNTKSLKSL